MDRLRPPVCHNATGETDRGVLVPSPSLPPRPASFAARLPFFFGWVIIAIAFLTVAVSVTTRTAFSLMFPIVTP